jgi:hypothetical protein
MHDSIQKINLKHKVMIIKNILYRFRIISLVILLTLVSSQVWSTAVVGYTLLSNNVATSGVAGNIGVCAFSHSSAGTITNNSAGAQIAGWNGANSAVIYWTTSSFSTIDYTNLGVVAQMKSDNLGPKNFQLQYKVGSGSWTNFGSAIVLTTSQSSIGNIILPDECSNNPDVTIRFLRVNNISVNNGTISLTGKSYIRNLSVDGISPSTPSTQASAISLISVTPTTITVTANTGNGSHWILKMNTINSFTTPEQNSNPTADLLYQGGEQVMSNELSSVTSVTVNVPSATNTYWFRVYSYNYNGGMTRFNSDEVPPSNPKYCALESIHLPTSANIKLTMATLGGTIDVPLQGPVSERGIYWGLNPGISENDIIESQPSLSGGTYTIDISNLEKSATIYFKAFVTNESGTIMSEESEFSNVPIFSGTGTWETDALWNVHEVPGAGGGINGDATDSPVINGICALNSNIICYDLTINSSKQLNIDAEHSLTVDGTLDNNAGVTGLVVNSGGSLIENSINVSATVKRDINSGKWSLISAPVSGAVSGIFMGKYLQMHTESTNSYTDILLPTEMLSPLKGFALWGGTSGFPAIYTGPLNTGSLSVGLTRSTVGENSGWNLVGNPYASSIDWDAASGWTKGNLNNAIYIEKNGGWASYVAGVGVNGGSRYIASGQGFFVNVADGSSTGALGMDNDVRVHNATAFYKNLISNLIRLEVSGNGYTDEAVVRILPEATSEFDREYDAHKLFGDISEAAQLYTLGPIPLAVNAFPETGNVTVGLRTSTSGIYKIAATEVNDLTAVSLEDTKTGVFTDLYNGPYTFNFSAGENEQRFVLHFSVLSTYESEKSLTNIYSNFKTVYVDLKDNERGIVFIYSISGQLVGTANVSQGSNKVNIANSGNYIVKVITNQNTLVKMVFVQ